MSDVLYDELGNWLPNKLIPRSFSRPLPVNEELREARKSPAYWWYRCLRANDEYEYCCRHKGKGKMAGTYADFGDVFGLAFDRWWVGNGRKIFTETKPLKKVRRLENDADLRQLRSSNNKLILEIPLTLRRQTASRQIGLLVKKAYEGRVIDVMEHSTARRKIIKSKMRMSTVEQLLKVLEVRTRNPKLTLNEVGIKAGIELDLMARSVDGEVMDDAAERRRMTLAVGRLLSQARNLVTNAGLGKFPSLKKPPAI